MIKDGLWDAFNGYHMGTTAENVATQYQITREQQDAVRRRARSNKAERGAEGRAASRTRSFRSPIKGRKGDTIVDATTNTSAMIRRSRRWRGCGPPSTRTARSRPAMPRGLNDGAAALVLMSAKEAGAPRADAARPHRRLRDGRRRSRGDGHRARSRPRARRWSAPAGRRATSTWSRPTRLSRRRPAR